MTAPASHSPGRWWRRRAVQILVPVLVLLLLLSPMVYLFGRLWISTGNAIGAVATERAAAAQARPLNRLLAALVDAQLSAVRGTAVDASGVRAAVDEADGVDRQVGDALRVRQRWTRLIREIDSVLAQNPRGAGALRAYATPIALTQALLDQIADLSNATRDPGSGSYHLLQVALQRLPDVVAAAGQLTALSGTARSATTSTAAPADRQLAVAVDRLARAADDVDIGLRAGADPAADDTVDLRLLGLLDGFTAAVAELNQAAAELDVPGSGSLDRIDAASVQVKAAALALETGVLDAVDVRVTAGADGYAGQRWLLVLAGVVVALAAGALLWLRMPRPAVPRAHAPGALDAAGARGDKAERRPGYPTGGDGVKPDGGQRIPNLVDARELLAPGLVHAGHAIRARTRQDSDDSQ